MKYKKAGLIFATFFFLLFLWQISSANFIIPKPLEIIKAFFDLLIHTRTWENVFASTVRVYVALFVAIIIGTAIGVLSFFNKKLSAVVNSLFYPSQYIASAVWTIIAIVLFGLSPITPYFIIAIVILPNIFVAVDIGLKNIRKDLLEYGKVYTNKKWRLFRYIVFPQLIPQLLIGVVRSNAIAWKIVVTAELFIGINGLGFMVNNYYRTMNTPKLFAVVLLIIIIGLAFDKLFKIIKERMVKSYD